VHASYLSDRGVGDHLSKFIGLAGLSMTSIMGFSRDIDHTSPSFGDLKQLLQQKNCRTRGYSLEHISPPHHVEIGTVSLPASSRCVCVSPVDQHCVGRYSSTATMCTVFPFYVKPSRRWWQHL